MVKEIEITSMKNSVEQERLLDFMNLLILVVPECTYVKLVSCFYSIFLSN